MDKRKVMNWVVTGVIFAIVAVNIINFINPQGIVGEQGPTFILPVLDEEAPLSLEDYQGRVVILDFWATWCPPCRKQMPALQALDDDPEFKEHLKVLSVNTDDANEEREMLVRTFLQNYNLTMTTLMDDGAVRSLYRVGAIPTLVVLDRAGKISHASAGIHSTDDLRQLVRKAM